jgi:acyl-CoA thioesterase
VTEVSGLEHLRAMVGRKIDAPYEKLFGIHLVEVLNGQVILEARPKATHYNLHGRVHGGFCASLIDTALGTSVLSSLDQMSPFGTVNLNVQYVRKVDAASGMLKCVAKVLHRGRSMLTCSAEVHDAASKLCAHGTGTFLIYPK